MKLKYVRAMLIGATGMIAVGGMVCTERNGSEVPTVSTVNDVETKSADAENNNTEVIEQIGISLKENVTVAQSNPWVAETEQSAEPAAETQTKENPQSALVAVEDNKVVVTAGVTAEFAEERVLTGVTLDDETKAAGTESAETGEEANGETDEAVNEESELVIATVNNYVNVRAEGDLDAEIVGKLYNYAIGTLLEETEDGWYYIESGAVTGYVKADYVLRGAEAAELADEVGQHLAEVTAEVLRVREEANTESEILELVPLGDILSVTEELDGWVKVSLEYGEGYVSADYVNVHTKYEVAESKEEEEERLAKEEEERRLAEEAAAQELARQQASQQSSSKKSSSQKSSSQKSSSKKSTSQKSTSQKSTSQKSTSQKSSSTKSNSGSGKSTSQKSTETTDDSTKSSSGDAKNESGTSGSEIANYALQFVGNPYVWGGTSLTKGADCSGFVMSVYKHFGISLPRTSGAQGSCGVDVGGIKNAQPGDLVWYSGHIAIYIGNGKIVHAASAKSGIKVSNANYRTILSVRRIV